MKRVKATKHLHYVDHPGKDFLYLFDLLAHTSGVESTLRVLTYADQELQQLCLPRISILPLEVGRVANYNIFSEGYLAI